MTTETTYREKGSAVLFAAMLVLSMVAMSAAFAGTTAADHEPGTTSITVGNLDGNTYWQGESLNVSGFNTDETVEITGPDDAFQQQAANGNGYLAFDTSSLGTGTWNVTGVDSGASAQIDIRTQSITDFSFDPSPTDGSTTMTVDSDRVDYNVSISADGVEASEWDAAIGSGTVYGDHYVLEISGDAADFSVDSTELPTGTHNVTVEVTDTTASDEASLTVESAPETSVGFAFSNVNDELGDVVEFNLTTSGEPDAVWATIMEDGENYEVHYNVTNIDDHSEPIQVDWNSHEALDAGSNYGLSAENGDITINDSSGAALGSDHWPNDRTWSFTTEAFTSHGDIADGNYEDVAGISFNERSTGDMIVSTAPGPGAHAQDAGLDDVLDNATEDTSIANQDLLVAEVDAPGVFGYLNTSPAGFATEGLEFSLSSPGGTFQDGTTLNASDISSENMTIHERPDDDAVYFVVESQNIAGMSTGDSWTAEFAVNGSTNPYVGDDSVESANSSYSLEAREVNWENSMTDDDELILAPSSDATLEASTNVAPDTSFSSRINLPRDFRTASGQVSDDGTVSATVDLDGVETGTQLGQVRLRVPNTDTQLSTEGVVQGDVEPASFGVSVDAPSEVNVDEDASVDVTVTNDGGQSGDAEITVDVGGETTETTETLDAGDSWEESFDVSTDSEGEVSWSVDTQHDSASGSVDVVAENDSDPDPDPDDDSSDDDGDGDGGGDGQPGFGLVVALFAILGAALLAARRQN